MVPAGLLLEPPKANCNVKVRFGFYYLNMKVDDVVNKNREPYKRQAIYIISVRW